MLSVSNHFDADATCNRAARSVHGPLSIQPGTYHLGRRRRQGRLPSRKARLQAIPHPRQRQVAPRHQSQLLLDVLPVLAIFPSVPKRKFLSVQALFAIGSLRAVQAATSFPEFSSGNRRRQKTPTDGARMPTVLPRSIMPTRVVSKSCRTFKELMGEADSDHLM